MRIAPLAAAALIALSCAAPAQDLDPSARIRADFAQASAGWAPLPHLVQEAFIASEDKHFRTRFPKPSILTAEIARWYPRPGQDRWARWVTTDTLSEALTAEEVLDWYLHGIFLGRGCFGVPDAARAYFGKEAGDLTLAEAASLAALPKYPVVAKDPARHAARRDFVLDEMVETGAASLRDVKAAKSTEIALGPGRCDKT